MVSIHIFMFSVSRLLSFSLELPFSLEASTSLPATPSLPEFTRPYRMAYASTSCRDRYGSSLAALT